MTRGVQRAILVPTSFISFGLPSVFANYLLVGVLYSEGRARRRKKRGRGKRKRKRRKRREELLLLSWFSDLASPAAWTFHHFLKNSFKVQVLSSGLQLKPLTYYRR